MLTTRYSSNAVLAKARTMYKFRLNSLDYQSLCDCKSVSEIASFLKNNTDYSTVLKSVNDKAIHRGQLEALIYNHYYSKCEILCRYEITVGDYFYKYIIDKAEIGIIMRFLMFLMSGRTKEYIYSFPDYMDKHSSINLKGLTNVTDYDGFLKLIENTEYYQIFNKNKPKNNIFDFAKVENELYKHLFSDVYAIIEQHTSGSEKKELYGIFNSYTDALNISRIFRLKRFLNDNSKIYENILGFGTLKKNRLVELINCDSEKALIEKLSAMPIDKKLKKYIDNTDREIENKVLTSKCRHNIHFSVFPSVVMLSYLFLAENEIKNITTIIEGVRYSLKKEEILDLLTF